MSKQQLQTSEQAERRAPEAAQVEDEAVRGALAAGATFSPPPPEHPTTRRGRQGHARAVQRLLGNQAAGRLLQRDGDTSLPPVPSYQLTPPSLLGEARRPGLLGDGPHLRLDPAIEAELRAMQVRAMLEPALVRPNLTRLPVGPLTPPPSSGQAPPLTAPAPQPAPAPAPGAGPATPQAGSAGDILDAIMAVPEVDQALTRLQTEASDRVRRDWRDLRLGGQVALISASALIAGGAIAGIASSPDAQRFIFGQLSGKVLPVPYLSFMRVEFNVQENNLMLGLHLDVGALLPSVLGFGPGSPSPIGGPPAPESPPWAPPAQRSLVRRSPVRAGYRSRPAGRVQRLGWAAIAGIGAAVVAAGAAIYEAAVAEERSLSEGEIAGAREIFAESIDYSQVMIKRHSLGSVGAPRTIGNTIALSEACFDGEEGMELSDYGRQTLIHELAHVWQYQNQGWEYAPGALWAQLKAAITTGSRNAAYDWESLADAGVPWEEWNPEAQAEAVEDYNNALQKQKAGTAEAADYATLAKAQPYIDLMRAGPPQHDASAEDSAAGPGGDGGGSGAGPGSDPLDGGVPAGTIAPLRRLALRRAGRPLGGYRAGARVHRQALVQRTPETAWERSNRAGQVDWVTDRRMILWNFQVGRSALKGAHTAALDQFFRANDVLFRNPAVSLGLSGHSSGSGPGAINTSVSNDRVRAVTAWVLGHTPVTPAQVVSTAVGAGRPLVAETSPAEMAHNRRVELEVQMPPGGALPGPDMHAGASVPDAAMQAEILGELGRPVVAAPAPAPGAPAPAPPAAVPWDGALVGGVLTPAARAARTALKNQVTAALQAHLNSVMPGIRVTAAQPRLPLASLEGPGQAAKTVVDARFGNFASAAALTAGQATTRGGFNFRASGPNQTLFDAFDPADRAATGSAISAESVTAWMADRDAARAAQAAHHFDANDSSRGPDEAAFLFNEIITPFANANRADLELYDQFGFALTPDAGRVVMYTGLRTDLSNAAPPGGMSPAERATRWDGWMTLIHEYIHTLEHPAYSSAASGNGVMREGFCEMFTKEVLDNALPTARADVALRTSVEGPGLPPPTEDILPSTYPPNAGYMEDYIHAVAIRNRIGDNAAKAAFFQGHVEYLGLTPASAPIAPSAGPQITVPAGVPNLAALAVATGVAEADIIAANPGVDLRAALPPSVAVPGASEHLVVEADDGGARQLETQAQIANQHAITAADLARANPGVDWAHLTAGQRLLIPRH